MLKQPCENTKKLIKSNTCKFFIQNYKLFCRGIFLRFLTLKTNNGLYSLIKTKEVQMQMSYSIDEARKVTGIGRTKLYEAINEGLLRARKYGKRTIILKDDLQKFLNSLESYST